MLLSMVLQDLRFGDPGRPEILLNPKAYHPRNLQNGVEFGV